MNPFKFPIIILKAETKCVPKNMSGRKTRSYFYTTIIFTRNWWWMIKSTMTNWLRARQQIAERLFFSKNCKKVFGVDGLDEETCKIKHFFFFVVLLFLRFLSLSYHRLLIKSYRHTHIRLGRSRKKTII